MNNAIRLTAAVRTTSGSWNSSRPDGALINIWIGCPWLPAVASTRKLMIWLGRSSVTVWVDPSGKSNQAERSWTISFIGVGPGSPMRRGMVPSREVIVYS